MGEFVMPILGADMRDGTLVDWLKGPGDAVHRGEAIARVETDKGDIDVEVWETGTIAELLVEPGTVVPVGTPLARIDGEVGAPAPTPPAPAAPAAGRAEPAPQHEAPAHARPAGRDHRVAISPSARRMAEELGLDPAAIAGSGPGGRITRADVERAAGQAPAPAAPHPAPPAADDRQARMRLAIARSMSHSAREIPHYHVESDIDVGTAVAWVAETNRDRKPAERLLLAAVLVKAVALALREVPELNGFWVEDHAVAAPEVHVGMAISLRGGGLVAPALLHADGRSLDELMAAFQDLVQRARRGGLRSSELSDATVTITSLGERGAERVHGLIFPPQVALIGFGRVRDVVVARDGWIGARPTITATLSADHRVTDGHRGSVFLDHLDRRLQHPEEL